MCVYLHTPPMFGHVPCPPSFPAATVIALFGRGREGESSLPVRLPVIAAGASGSAACLRFRRHYRLRLFVTTVYVLQEVEVSEVSLLEAGRRKGSVRVRVV